MANWHKKILATLITVPVLFLTFTAPAFASTEGATENWDTVLHPNNDGTVSVTSTISSINASESIDLALPVAPLFNESDKYAASSSKYAYTNPTINEGYSVKTVKNNNWNIFSVKNNGSTTSPIVLNYTVSGAIFDTTEAQQLNFPLIDSSHNDKINSYSVAFDTSDKEYIPTDVCISKPTSPNGCNAMTDYKWSSVREQGERISLRAKFKTGTFNIVNQPVTAESTTDPSSVKAVMPSKYLKTFSSWDYKVNADPDDGLTHVENTISYNKNKDNSNVIVIAYPSYLKNRNDVGFDQIYSQVALSDESAKLYNLEFQKGAKGKNELALITITPQEGAVIPTKATLTYHYTVNGAVMENGGLFGGQQFSFVAKTKIPDSVVHKVSVKLNGNTPLPSSSNSSCANNPIEKMDLVNGFTCEISDDGISYLIDGNIHYGSIDYTYDNSPFTIDNSTRIDTNNIDIIAIGTVVLVIFEIILFGFLIVMLITYLREHFLLSAKEQAHQFVENKAFTYIPAEGEKENKLKLIRGDIFANLPNIAYSPPTLDNGEEIPSYLYEMLTGEINTTVKENKITLAVLTSMVTKGEIRMWTDRKDIFVSPLQKNSFEERFLTPTEEAVLKTLKANNSKSWFRLSNSTVKELFESSIRGNITKELDSLGLTKYKVKGLAKGLVSYLAGVGSLIAALVVLYHNFNPFGIFGAAILIAGTVLFFSYGTALLEYETISTVKGTGYRARIEAFHNYYRLARPESRYSLEKADFSGKYLPWAIMFNDTLKWSEVFAAISETNSSRFALGVDEIDLEPLVSRMNFIVSGEEDSEEQAYRSRVSPLNRFPFSIK